MGSGSHDDWTWGLTRPTCAATKGRFAIPSLPVKKKASRKKDDAWALQWAAFPALQQRQTETAAWHAAKENSIPSFLEHDVLGTGARLSQYLKVLAEKHPADINETWIPPPLTLHGACLTTIYPFI